MPAQIVRRKLPGFHRRANPIISQKFEKELFYSMPSGGTIRCSGTITASPAAVVSTKGTLLYEPSRQIAKTIYQQPVIRKRSLRAIQEFPAVFYATFDQGHSFYHWLYDVLPLLILEPFRSEVIQRQYKVILPPFLNSFQKQSLEMADLSALDTITTADFSTIQSGNIYVPILPQTTGQPHAVICDALRSTFLPHICPASKCRRVYLSRQKATRHIENETELFSVLHQFGFELVVTEDLTFSEQIELFAGAKIVVSPHGAGLSHMVFMPPGGIILELFSSGYVNPCYWRLANLCRHDYSMMTGCPTGAYSRSDIDNYSIDVPSLSRAINGLIENEQSLR